MGKTDTVMVKALRPFEGVEGYKHEGSEPFEVDRRRLAELKANGLVEEHGPEQKAAPPAENKMAAEPENKAGDPSTSVRRPRA